MTNLGHNIKDISFYNPISCTVITVDWVNRQSILTTTNSESIRKMSGEYVREPCIKYDSKFEHSKLDKVELVQTWEDGTKTKKKCPVFTGDHGIEALLYVEGRLTLFVDNWK